jgi:hypothetical protein
MRRQAGRSIALLFVALAVAGCGSPNSELGGDDQDGIVGGDKTFEIRVDDDVFLPVAIWKTQNLANVTLNLKNVGTRAHGFRVHCLGAQCFPDATTISPIDPGGATTAKFQAPYREGSYEVDDDTADGPKGQFILQ